MKAKAKRTAKESSPCVCQGAGPVLTDLLRQLGPPKAARRHFDAARVEFLKGLRAILDERIARREKPEAKGEKIDVE
jgi:hypothetical protein